MNNSKRTFKYEKYSHGIIFHISFHYDVHQIAQ